MNRSAANREHLDQRAKIRCPVGIPALALSDGTKSPISILNITADGAMIDTTKMFEPGSALVVQCGTMCATAKVVWQRPDRKAGLKFLTSLSEAQVEEQIARNAAISSFRARRTGG
jgi:hypothetical protein